MQAEDLLVSSGMGQVFPKNYPVAEIISVYADPGLDFATVRARPIAQMASTRHVMLVFQNEEEQSLNINQETEREISEETVSDVEIEGQASQIQSEEND